MSAVAVTVIDYGIGNLLNVVRALQHCGASVTIVDRASLVTSLPDRLVLPGVGAFKDGMIELRRRGFDDLVTRYVQTQRPFLGICVGAQMLFEVGEEFGEHSGLGLIPGRVTPVPPLSADGTAHRIPHIGWSPLMPSGEAGDWDGTILSRFEPGRPVYFVHSFAPSPAMAEHRLAMTSYDGVPICAAVRRENIYGCQFHPERSGPDGLGILSSFLAL